MPLELTPAEMLAIKREAALLLLREAAACLARAKQFTGPLRAELITHFHAELKTCTAAYRRLNHKAPNP